MWFLKALGILAISAVVLWAACFLWLRVSLWLRVRNVQAYAAAAETKLRALEERDAESIAQGKSYDEIISRYRERKN